MVVPTDNASAQPAIYIGNGFRSRVRDEFQDDLRKHAEFIEVIENYMEQRISIDMLISRVRELFRGHPELLLGFNTFLPEGYKMEHPIDDLSQFEDAVQFVEKVKLRSRFQANSIYKQFLHLLESYPLQCMPLDELYEKVVRLFNGYQDLVNGFSHFMPDFIKQPQQQHSLSGRYLSAVGFSVGSLNKTFIDMVKSHKVVPTDDSDTRTKSDVKYYLKHVKDAFGYKKGKYDEFMVTLDEFRLMSINFNMVTSRLRELFKGHPDLLLGLNYFFLKRFLFYPDDDQRPAQKKAIVLEDAVRVMYTVRAKLHIEGPLDVAAIGRKHDDAEDYLKHVEDAFRDNRKKYHDFLTILEYYCIQRTNLNIYRSKVRELFRGHPNLLLGFNAFLPKHCEVVLPGDDLWSSNKIPLEPGDATHFVEKAKSCFQSDEQFCKSFIDIIDFHLKQKVLWFDDYLQVVQLIRDHHDLLMGFSNLLYPLRTSTRSLASSPPCNERNSTITRTKIYDCCLLCLISFS